LLRANERVFIAQLETFAAVPVLFGARSTYMETTRHPSCTRDNDIDAT
jgi:hypothetical protein